MKNFFEHLNDHPRLVATIGAGAGWAGASIDWLRWFQIVSVILAALVSLCALILTARKALREVRSWFTD